MHTLVAIYCPFNVLIVSGGVAFVSKSVILHSDEII